MSDAGKRSEVSERFPANRWRSFRRHVHTSAQAKGRKARRHRRAVTPAAVMPSPNVSATQRRRPVEPPHNGSQRELAAGRETIRPFVEKGEEHSLKERSHSSPVDITATNQTTPLTPPTRTRMRTRRLIPLTVGKFYLPSPPHAAPQLDLQKQPRASGSAYACVFSLNVRERARTGGHPGIA